MDDTKPLCGGLSLSLLLGSSLSRSLSSSLLRGSPLGGLGPLRLLPRAHVAKLAASSTLAGTAELNRKVLSGDLSQQLLLVVGAENVDLVHGHRVKEALDHAEHAAEAPGGVDQVKLAQTLGVVVLGDGRRLLDVAVNGRDAGDTDALQVHDGAASLEQLTSLAGAGGQTGVGKLLILGHEVLEHALAGGDLVHGIEVNLAQLLDVDRTAILFGVPIVSVSTSLAVEKKRSVQVTHLVRFVVVLGVVFEDLGLLGVLESTDELISAELLPPLLAVDEPLFPDVDVSARFKSFRFP